MTIRELLYKDGAENADFAQDVFASKSEEDVAEEMKGILSDYMRRVINPGNCEKIIQASGLTGMGKAALSFLVFSLYADKNDIAKANDHLAAALPFIYAEYKLPESTSSLTLSLYRTGSTSYILADRITRKVIKILNYLYFNNTTIRESTLNYKDEFKSLEVPCTFIPRIEKCDDTFMIMDLLPGAPLSEYRKKLQAKFNEEPLVAVDCARQMAVRLCANLAILFENKVRHKDLSPSNILVEEKNGAPSEVYLIDFGYNYVLEERIGNRMQFFQLQKYLAPEVLEDHLKVSETSDVFSLGMILLEIFSGAEFTPIRYDKLLSQVGEILPGVAAVIESATDPNPEKRLVDLEVKNNERDQQNPFNPFASVSKEVQNSVEMYQELESKKQGKLRSTLNDILALI
jgi:serine/threonine protein kinase